MIWTFKQDPIEQVSAAVLVPDVVLHQEECVAVRVVCVSACERVRAPVRA